MAEFVFEHFLRRRTSPRPIRWEASVIDTILELHRLGYTHGDLQHHNLLLRPDKTGESVEVYLTDFDVCAQEPGEQPRPGQLLDLARLGASLGHAAPEWLLERCLARYFSRLRLDRLRRRQCHALVQEAYCRFLGRFARSLAEVEARCFEVAERQLKERRVSV